jgi:hypothetical protein
VTGFEVWLLGMKTKEVAEEVEEPLLLVLRRGLGGGTVKRRIFWRIAKNPVPAAGVFGVRSGSVSDELPSIALFSSYSVFMTG